MIDEVYWPAGDSAFWHQGDERPPGFENPLESINLAWAMTPDPSNLQRFILRMVVDMHSDIFKPPFDDTLDTGFIKQTFGKLVYKCKEAPEDLEGEGDKKSGV